MLWNKSVSGILKFIFARGDIQCNAHRAFFAARTWQINKKKPVRISKNADTLLMIDPLWLTLCSYFANVLEFDTLLIQLNDT